MSQGPNAVGAKAPHGRISLQRERPMQRTEGHCTRAQSLEGHVVKKGPRGHVQLEVEGNDL